MIQPLRNYVLVEPFVRELSTILWNDNRENFCNGKIIAVGKKVTGVKPGDEIAYGGETYLNWKTIDDDGHKVQLIQEADICCVIERGFNA